MKRKSGEWNVHRKIVQSFCMLVPEPASQSFFFISLFRRGVKLKSLWTLFIHQVVIFSLTHRPHMLSHLCLNKIWGNSARTASQGCRLVLIIDLHWQQLKDRAHMRSVKYSLNAAKHSPVSVPSYSVFTSVTQLHYNIWLYFKWSNFVIKCIFYLSLRNGICC